MIILLNVKNAFDKIEDSLMIKVLERLGIKGIDINIIKAVYSKPIAKININRNSEQFH